VAAPCPIPYHNSPAVAVPSAHGQRESGRNPDRNRHLLELKARTPFQDTRPMTNARPRPGWRCRSRSKSSFAENRLAKSKAVGEGPPKRNHELVTTGQLAYHEEAPRLPPGRSGRACCRSLDSAEESPKPSMTIWHPPTWSNSKRRPGGPGRDAGRLPVKGLRARFSKGSRSVASMLHGIRPQRCDRGSPNPSSNRLPRPSPT